MDKRTALKLSVGTPVVIAGPTALDGTHGVIVDGPVAVDGVVLVDVDTAPVLTHYGGGTIHRNVTHRALREATR